VHTLAVGLAIDVRKAEGVANSAGTPGYMAPETYQEDSPIALSYDMWAIGCIMYEMLFAFPPFGEF
jgi:serine/threonine protein kinase